MLVQVAHRQQAGTPHDTVVRAVRLGQGPVGAALILGSVEDAVGFMGGSQVGGVNCTRHCELHCGRETVRVVLARGGW